MAKGLLGVITMAISTALLSTDIVLALVVFLAGGSMFLKADWDDL